MQNFFQKLSVFGAQLILKSKRFIKNPQLEFNKLRKKTVKFVEYLTRSKIRLALAIIILASSVLLIVIVIPQSGIRQMTERHCSVDFDCQSIGGECSRSICINKFCSAPINKPDGATCADKTWNQGTCSNGACTTLPICEYSDPGKDGYLEKCTGFNGPKKDTCTSSTSIQYAFCNPSTGCYDGSSVKCPDGQFCRVKKNGEPECYIPSAPQCNSDSDCISNENECLRKVCDDGVCSAPLNKSDGTTCTNGKCKSGACEVALAALPTSTPTRTPTRTPTPVLVTNFSTSYPTSAPTPTTGPTHKTIDLASGAQTFSISGGHHSPNFTQAVIDPLKVAVGDTQTMTVKISDTYSVTSVEARVQTDNGTEIYPLSLIDGTDLDGTWQSSWTVHDTHTTTYRTTFYAIDSNNETGDVTLTWSDPCTIINTGIWVPTTICSVGNDSRVTGIDGVDLRIDSGKDMTINANSTFYFTSGNSITMNGGHLIKSSGSSIVKVSALYAEDKDGDGYPASDTVYASPGTGRVRISALPNFVNYSDGTGSMIDYDDNNPAIYPGTVCNGDCSTNNNSGACVAKAAGENGLGACTRCDGNSLTHVNIATLNDAEGSNTCAGTCAAYCSSGSCINTNTSTGTCTVSSNNRVVSGGDGHCTSSSCVADGGPTPTPTLFPNGTACGSAGQCTSGYCADGVCCNTACNSSVNTGGTISYSGSNKIHTFTGNGTFTVNTPVTAQILVVGGGGGGGSYVGGGGGGGGFYEGTSISMAAGSYTITVGNGGSGGSGGGAADNTNGGNSSVVGGAINLVAIGGGAGGRFPDVAGAAGGSGGGTGGCSAGGGSGGAAQQPGSSTGGYGYKGGNMFGSRAATETGARGGGGAGAAAGDTSCTEPGDGGAGRQSSITGTVYYYAGGGGGGSFYAAETGTARAGNGGLGGGGGGGIYSSGTVGTGGTGGTLSGNYGSFMGNAQGDGGAGAPNTGGGGGGCGHNNRGGNGGTGIVIISYPSQGTCETCGAYSSAGAGTCGYVNSSSQDPGSDCTAGYTACSDNNRIGPDDNCSGSGYTCKTSGQSSACTARTTCQDNIGGCSYGSCVSFGNQLANSDSLSECAASYNACSGNNRIGPDGNCNGSGACNATGLSQACATRGVCQAGGGCSGGSCVAVTNQSAAEDLYNECTAASCTTGFLNSASGQSCATQCAARSKNSGLCNGSGACAASAACGCSANGSSPTSGDSVYYYYSPSSKYAAGGCFTATTSCAGVMSVDGYSCNGAASYWTYCFCQ